MINGGRPPSDHRRTTGQRWLTASQQPGLAGNGLGLDRVGSGSATWHATCQLTWQLTWRGGDRPSCDSNPRPLGMDKSKITRKQSKTSKHGHGNQKSTKRSQRIKAEARKVKPQVKSVKSRGYLSSLKITSHVINGRSTRGVGFCAKTLSKEAQVSLKRIATLAIRVRSLIDPTAKIFDPMIMTMSGED
ncbi:hypothetical protein Tco_1386436 [Tanacetum coccineum]